MSTAITATVYCGLHDVSFGRFHAKQLARTGEAIEFELRACYGATGCMRDKDPYVGMVAITWDCDSRVSKVRVTVEGQYPNSYYRDVLNDVAMLVGMATQTITHSP